jgi:hypothetical protein
MLERSGSLRCALLAHACCLIWVICHVRDNQPACINTGAQSNVLHSWCCTSCRDSYNDANAAVSRSSSLQHARRSFQDGAGDCSSPDGSPARVQRTISAPGSGSKDEVSTRSISSDTVRRVRVFLLCRGTPGRPRVWRNIAREASGRGLPVRTNPNIVPNHVAATLAASQEHCAASVASRMQMEVSCSLCSCWMCRA